MSDRRTVPARVADLIRKYADRIDHAGAPKATHWTFTFEDREGARFREDGRGCRMWYYGDADYEKAHGEADSPSGSAAAFHAMLRAAR